MNGKPAAAGAGRIAGSGLWAHARYPSQDFLAGRYALAQRAGASVTRQEVDACFRSGQMVRSWTMRGTLHTVLSRDVRWLMALTKKRTLQKVAPRLRELQISTATIDTAGTLIHDCLEVHGSASRKALYAELNAHGIETTNQRGIHLLMVLVQDALICLGPIPEGAAKAAQDFVLLDQWVRTHREPKEPLQELLVRYLSSHGPATLRDAAWYNGQTLTAIRRAAADLGAALSSAGVDGGGEDLWVVACSGAERQIAAGERTGLPPRLLGSFDEYYLSYAQRSTVATEELARQIAPGKNGMFLPFWLVDGQAQRLWNAKAAPTDSLGAALHQRYLAFRSD
ncbi:MAG: winged helix DNA-binding domain-containing protein [Glutamicibacter ardleyensis]